MILKENRIQAQFRKEEKVFGYFLKLIVNIKFLTQKLRTPLVTWFMIRTTAIRPSNCVSNYPEEKEPLSYP